MTARRRSTGRRLAALLLLLAVTGVHPGSAAGQSDDPGRASAIAGASLGLYSGGVLAFAGSLFPCNRTVLGPKCAAVSGLVGAGVGMVAGGIIGGDSTEAVRDRARGAVYGTVVGGVVGIVLQQAVRQYSWTDAVTVSLIGAAVGAAPRGGLIGTGIGAALGGLLWAGHRQDALSNLMLMTLAGAALGGLYDWVDGAVDAGGGAPALAASFSLPLG